MHDELHIQRFLRTGFSNSFEKLLVEHCIDATFSAINPSLVLLKYAIDADFKNPLVRECRGIILDTANNFSIVSRAMDKFANYGEVYAATIDWKAATVFEKLDGSLAVMYPYNGVWNFATSGAPDASGDVNDFGFTFAEMFKRIIDENGYKLPAVDCNICFWFEATSAYNKVCVLHGKPMLTLLGARDLATQKELTLAEASVYLPNIPVVKSFTLSDFESVLATLLDMNGLKQEGYVVCDSSFNRIKVKCPDYVRLHHLRDNTSSMRGIVDVVRNGEVGDITDAFPELKVMILEAKNRYDSLIEECMDTYSSIKDIVVQKEFALEAVKFRCPGALFAVRSRKTTSFQDYLRGLQVDSVMALLGYKGKDKVVMSVENVQA